MPNLIHPKVQLKGHITLTHSKRVMAKMRARVAKEAEVARRTVKGQKVIFYKTKNGIVPIKIIIGKTSGKVFAHHQPVTHGITGTKNGAYHDLLSILKEGFNGRTKRGSDNVIISTQRLRRGQKMSPEKTHPLLFGDAYSIETISKLASVEHGLHLKNAKPNEIISVNIAINPELSKEENEKRKSFYKNEIQKKLGFPVKFVTVEIKP